MIICIIFIKSIHVVFVYEKWNLYCDKYFMRETIWMNEVFQANDI